MAQRLPAALLVLLGTASAVSCSADTRSTARDTSGAGAPGSNGGAGGNAGLVGSGGSSAVQCPSDQRLCDGECANVSSDPNHCGSCEGTCSQPNVCSSGACVAECEPGQRRCGQSCVDDLQTDSAHCGACDRACVAGQSCVAGDCVCMGGTTLCGGQCVDTDVNALHCGRCNSPCHDGVCQDGVCLPAVGGADGVEQGSGGGAGAAALGGSGTGGSGAGGSGGAAVEASGGALIGTGGSRVGAGGAEASGSMGGNSGGMGGIAGSAPRTGGAGGEAGASGSPTGGYASWYTCPAALPSNGDPCYVSGRGALATCAYDECPAGTVTGPRYVASCPSSPTGSGTWTVRELDCPQATECGECPPGLDCSAECLSGAGCGTNQCPVGQICLRMVYPDDHWNWGCAPNNCQAQPLDCSCAGAVCGQDLSGDWQCAAADDPIVTCECVDGC